MNTKKKSMLKKKKRVVKKIEEYENRCKTLNIPSILEIVEYRRNKEFKKI